MTWLAFADVSEENVVWSTKFCIQTVYYLGRNFQNFTLTWTEYLLWNNLIQKLVSFFCLEDFKHLFFEVL